MKRFKKSIGNYAMKIEGVDMVITSNKYLHVIVKDIEYLFEWERLKEFCETYGMETTKKRLKEKIMEGEN